MSLLGVWKIGKAIIQSLSSTIYTVYLLCFRMESFFLAETAKYLYLIFDENNFIHNDGATAKLIETTNGPCMIEGRFYSIKVAIKTINIMLKARICLKYGTTTKCPGMKFKIYKCFSFKTVALYTLLSN